MKISTPISPRTQLHQNLSKKQIMKIALLAGWGVKNFNWIVVKGHRIIRTSGIQANLREDIKLL